MTKQDWINLIGAIRHENQRMVLASSPSGATREILHHIFTAVILICAEMRDLTEEKEGPK